ncbi:hypothetical protein GJ496_009381 [Pomphorhynchus laevis]|nr:hypothetical protein GJ496_009381 [Pomphorhynchus laevis]
MQDRVEFLGHAIYRDTLMPSKTKVAAIRMCPTPRSNTELRTFLRSVNYLSKFIPESQWTAEHEKAFEVVKETMLDARVLQPFNIAAEVHIASDASESGLGAVMFQKATKGKMMPVGVDLFAVQLRYSIYPWNGKCFSRHSVSIVIEEYQVGSSEEEFISLIQDAALTDLQLMREQIRNESLVDRELKQIRRYLESGWPNGCNQWVTTYRSRAHELSSEDGILLWLQRIVIPTSLRQKAKQVLHTGHPGIKTMKELARRYCWWPSIESDIEHTVGTC